MSLVRPHGMSTWAFLFIPILFIVSSGASQAGALVESPRGAGAADVRAKSVASSQISAAGRLSPVVIFAGFAGEDTVLPAYSRDFFRRDLPGSLTHFYESMSFGGLLLDGSVLPRVYLSRASAADYLRSGGTFSTFVLDVIQQADREIDFGRFDNDGPDGLPNSGDDDGIVDCVFINLQSIPPEFITGTAIGTATGIGSLGLSSYATDDIAVGGGYIEIGRGHGTVQRVLDFAHAVGSMAHEFGHLLGLPDQYDTVWETPADESAGVGGWCLMGRGATGWNSGDGPNSLCARCREQLGWARGGIRDVLQPITQAEIQPVGAGGAIYRIPIISDPTGVAAGVIYAQRQERPLEYFLVENRRRNDSFYDRNIPGEGLLIWHVNGMGSSGDERSKQLDLECADGKYQDAGFPLGRTGDSESGGDNLDFWSRDESYRVAHGGNIGDATDPFDGERFTAFTPNTNPSSLPENGTVRPAWLPLSITNIRKRADGAMTADITPGRWAGTLIGDGVGRQAVGWSGTVEVVGDLVVGENVTLTIEAGTTVRISPGDLLHSGEDPDRVEIVVRGDLKSLGTSANPVSFVGADWYGIRWEKGSSITVFSPDPQANRLEGAKAGLVSYSGPFSRQGLQVLSYYPSVLSPGSSTYFTVTLWNPTLRDVSVQVAGMISPGDSIIVGNMRAYPVAVPSGYTVGVWLNLNVSSDAPLRKDLPLVLRLMDSNTKEVQVDTLRIDIDGVDKQPPTLGFTRLPFYTIRVGVPINMSLTVGELGPLSQVRVYVTDYPGQAVLDSLVVFDRGRDGDKYNTSFRAAARSFSVAWTPDREMDFRFVATAVDAAGNVARDAGSQVVRAESFHRTSDILLYGPKYLVDKCARILDAAGIAYDIWTIDRDGQILPAVLELYRTIPTGVVIWLSPQVTGPALKPLNAFIQSGGRVLTSMGRLGGGLLSTTEMQFFLGALLGAASSTTAPASWTVVHGVGSDPVARGIVAKASAYNAFTPLGRTRPVLVDDSGTAVALRIDNGTYKVVHFGFSLLEAQKEEAVKTLLLNTIAWLSGSSSDSSGTGDPGPRDVAVTSVISPAASIGKRLLLPSADVSSIGVPDGQELPFACTIRDPSSAVVYADTARVAISVDRTDTTVTFRPWLPAEFGSYQMIVESLLADDANKANDLAELTFRVVPLADVASDVGVVEQSTGRGVAVADVDGDGDLDIYVSNWGAPGVLYVNERIEDTLAGGGVTRGFAVDADANTDALTGAGVAGVVGWRFADGTTNAGLPADSAMGRGAVFFDADNDGDPDLYLGREGPDRFYRNAGGGRFVDATAEVGLGDPAGARSVVTVDVDGDGDLDLYVVNADAPNRLYRNRSSEVARGDSAGFLRFEDATQEFAVGDRGSGRGAVFGDIDGDGDQDLYVANFLEANRLYRNDGSRFTDITDEAGVGYTGRSNGASFGDIDNDGDLDLVVAAEGKPVVYENVGEGHFRDVSEESGLTPTGAWVTPVLTDFSNDGDLDCYISDYGGGGALFENDGHGRFSNRSADLGAVTRGGFGAVAGDFDGNGAVDMYVAASGQDIVYENAWVQAHYLTVRLEGTRGNRDGVGALVRVVSGDLTQVREVSGGSGYCSQGSQDLTFGLGERTVADSLEVRWPAREKQALVEQAADRILRVLEPSPPTDVEQEAGTLSLVPDSPFLAKAVPNPFNSETVLRWGQPSGGNVRLYVYDVGGRCVRRLLDGPASAGFWEARWNGRDDRELRVASGVYICRLETTAAAAAPATVSQKVVLIR